jgi:DNA polymerase
VTQTLTLDVESTSECDLKKSGVAAYWQHPSTVLICVSWRVDHGPVYTWRPGENPPPFANGYAHNGTWRIVAHNFLFEYWCWKEHLGPKHKWGPVPPSLPFWDCTMARALYWGLPAGLLDVARVLNLPHQIDPAKKSRIKRMARPRGHDKITGKPIYWHDTDPDKLNELLADCENDVLTECDLDEKLPPLPPREREIFLIDADINIRGITLDLPVVDALTKITKSEGDRLNDTMSQITAGAVTKCNQNARILKNLEAYGVDLPDLTKATVADALKKITDATAVGILLTRQEASKASTAKLHAMTLGASPDGRARGLFQYCGAGRTHRWAARRIQPQNIPRGVLKGLASVFNLIEKGHVDPGVLASLLPCTVMDAVSSMLRGCLIASPGHLLVSADLSQIEARLLAWYAGQQDVLDIFARGEDLYMWTARQVGSTDRQLGKVLVLACVARDTLVLTSVGWKPIQELTTQDKVWDGLEWVEHTGLLERGTRETLSASGLPLTPDHLVLCGTTWKPALSLAQDGGTRSLALATASANLPLWALSQHPHSTCSTDERSASCKSGLPNSKPLSQVYDLANCGPRNRFTIWTDEGPLITHNCGFGMGAQKFMETALTYGLVLTLEEAEKYVKAWRALNAKSVQFWWDCDGAFRSVAQGGHRYEERVGHVIFRKTSKAVRIVLPSGSELTFHNVELVINPISGRDDITFMGVDPKTKQWSQQRTYGGKIVENIVQASDRDILAECMLTLRKIASSPYPAASAEKALKLLGNMHDELLGEAPWQVAQQALDLVIGVMRRGVTWAPGLPVGAEGFTAKRYKK